MIDQNVGRYRIKSELGRGGMATVYLAQDPHFERDVAIKVLPREFLHDPTFLERFTQEARTIARLEHRNILPVYDFGEVDGIPYIVMRYMPAKSLRDRLNTSPDEGLPLAEIEKWVQQVAEALDFAHQHGVIHRDLKPDNVLLDAAGNVYLSDFGIAKVIEATQTFSGTLMVGTPNYMAPEQVRGGKPSPQTDVYAFGAMLFELLAGSPPFKADDALALAFLHVNEPVPQLEECRPGLPAGLQALVERAMAKDPQARYQSASQMAQALSEVLSAGAHAAAQPAASPAAPQAAPHTPQPAPPFETVAPPPTTPAWEPAAPAPTPPPHPADYYVTLDRPQTRAPSMPASEPSAPGSGSGGAYQTPSPSPAAPIFKPLPTPQEQPKPKRRGRKVFFWLVGIFGLILIVILIVQANQPSYPNVVYMRETVVVEVAAPTATPRPATAIPTPTMEQIATSPPPTEEWIPTSIPETSWQQYESELYTEGEDYTDYLVAEGYGPFQAYFDFVMYDDYGENGYICPSVRSEDDISSTAWTTLSTGQIAVDMYFGPSGELIQSPEWVDAPYMNVGIGEYNNLEVITHDDLITWILNGDVVAEFYYPTYIYHQVFWKNCDPIVIAVEQIYIEGLE